MFKQKETLSEKAHSQVLDSKKPLAMGRFETSFDLFWALNPSCNLL